MSEAPAGAWRAPALSALGGVLAALAFPPYGLLPGVFGYALVLHAWTRPAPAGRARRAAFLRGWAAGTGYLAVCTAWIVEPFLIDVAAHGWQAPFAVIGTSAGIGLLWGAAGLAFHLLRPARAWRALVFAAVLALAEWVRGHLFTGFPWDLPGETWRAGSPLSQGAAAVGAYGMGVVTLAIGAAPAALLDRTIPLRLRMVDAAAGVLLLAAVGGGGAWRLAHPPAVARSAPLTLRIVQPDLPEPPAWSPEVQARALGLYTALTAGQAAKPADLVLWPEGAIPASFNELYAPGAPAAVQVAAGLRPGQTLLTGGYRVEGASAADARYFNSLIALRRDPSGLRLAAAPYDKHHLVPFGESLPLAPVMGALGLRAFIGMPADFTPGPRPQPLSVAGAALQPLICYEALFPALAAPARGGPVRARLLVNVSDDAWFGRWAGPWQHLNLASYRAIEEGLPMVRATPTGVSAVIDGLGRTTAFLPPGARGVIDAPGPPPLPPTPYARWRDLPFALFEAAVLLLTVLQRRHKRDVT